MTKPIVAGIIPARYASSRLPGKPVKTILGMSMIERVCRRCAESELLDIVCVATDDERIAAAVEGFGGRAVLTRADHLSGTDRLAEAAQCLEADIIVNIQGDQPFIDPAMIEEALRPMLDDPSVELSTLICPIQREEDFRDPAFVKAVVDLAGKRSLLLPVAHSLPPQGRRTRGVRACGALRLPQGDIDSVGSTASDRARTG